MLRTIRLVLLTAALAVSLVPSGFAQTTLSTTTLTQAATETGDQIAVLSTSGIAVNDYVFIDREFMQVRAINSPYLRVSRGVNSVASPHVNFSVVTFGARTRFYANDPKPGRCTRGSDGAEFLPHISVSTGNSWDCPATVLQSWQLMNPRGVQTIKSVWFTLGNAGATVNEVILDHPRPININSCRVVYVGATSGTVAGGSVTVGTLINTGDIVAVTPYENAKAVGSTTALVVNTGQVSANSPIHIRHAGVGTTQAGSAIVECEYEIR